MGFSTILIGNQSLTAECGRMLLEAGHAIAAVVTRCPRSGAFAEDAGLPVIEPGPGLAARLEGLEADWLISAANLDLLPPEVLAHARLGAVNFHDGPLPDLAGLNAPIWAIAEGRAEHAITWHLIDEGIDSGDILVTRRFEIRPGDTAFTLNARCFAAGIDSFDEVIAALAAGAALRQPQDLSQRRLHTGAARPAPLGRLDFTRPAAELERLVRALDHGGYANPVDLPKVAIGAAVQVVERADVAEGAAAPGTVLAAEPGALVVACGAGAIRLFGDFTADPGAVLPVPVLPGAEAAASAEAFWRGRLTALTACRLPLADGAGGAALSAKVPGAGPAAFAALAWRLSPEGNALALGLPSEAPGWLSPWVPVELATEASLADLGASLQAETARARSKGPFAADLPRRMAGAAMQMPGFALSADGPLPGAALTLAGEVLHGDPAQLSPAQFALTAARLATIAAADPATPLAGLDILPEAERQLVLHGWNQTDAAFDTARALHAQIAAMAAAEPGAPAIAFEAMTLTRAALEARANALAQALRAAGVQRGTLVGLHLSRSADLVAGALAIWKAGGAYVPLDPAYPAERIALYLEDSGAPVVLTESALAGALPGKARTVFADREPDSAAALPEAGCAPDDLAYLIYTSGSTGRPKGVMITHRNVSNFFTGMDGRLAQAPPGTWLAVTSLSFDISVLELFWTLARGFKLVLSGDQSRALVSGGSGDGVGAGAGAEMDFSLFYWGNDGGTGRDKYRLLLEGAAFADTHGFTALWTPERHFHAFGGPYPNPAVTGAAVAGMTKNLAIRAGSCVAPLHHTARIAEEWAVIDNLTNGRAGLAIASGWQPDDFVLRPENTPPANKEAMFAQIDQLRKLWSGEPVAYPRADGTPFEVVTQPRPVSARLPIWVTTAGNPETWREAGRIGANVLTHLLGQTVNEVGEKIALYHQALREAGHDPADFTVTLMLHAFLAETRDQARAIAREPMKDYLRAAAGLIKHYAWAFPAFKKPQGVASPMQLDLGTLEPDELEAILDFAFERYFEESGLFGTVADALARIEAVKAIGVGEVACLIDYGIDTDVVLAGLRPLSEVVAQANRALQPDDYSIAAQIRRHGVTHLQCTPSMARMLVTNDESRAALGRIKHLMIGGEALPAALLGELQSATSATITNLYGPTETTIWSTSAPASAERAIAGIGTPIANTQAYVLDAAMQPAPIGVPGELWIGGEGVARGYWGREDLTDQRFRPDPFREGGRMYRTGDEVRWRPDGALDFIGRADGQIKLRGYRIELGEIEAALEAQPEVAQAVVMLREDRPGNPQLVAYLKGADLPAEATLKARLASLLPAAWLPAHIVVVAAFPLTPNRKIDRKALPPPRAAAAPRPAPAPASVPSPAPAAPGLSQAAAEAAIADVWTRVLGTAPTGPSANFFELGGHSLLAVQAHRELRAALGTKALSITDIFRFPTLSALAGRIATGTAVPDTPRPPPKSLPEPANLALSPTSPPTASTRQDAIARRRAMRDQRRAAR